MADIAVSQATERQRQNQRAWDHYQGTPPQPLKVKSGIDDNLILSFGRLIVDKGASFLFGEPPTMQVPDDEDASNAIQDWLDECWRQNKASITLLKLGTNGGIFGHAFIRLLDRKPYPRLVVLDPQIVDVVTDPDDIDSVWQFTITPPPIPDPDDDENPYRRRTVISSPNGDAGDVVNVEQKWTITDQRYTGGAWVNESQSPWPYPFCPVLHCQNLPKPNDFWGESDLPEDVLKILEGINRVASHYNKIIRLHAHPKVWTRGMGKGRIDMAIDAVISLPSDTAELKSLEMQSDLSSTQALLDELKQDLSMVTRIPLVAMGIPDQLGSPSGVSLQIRYQPLLEKNEAKRATYGDMLIEANRCLLQMSPAFADSSIVTTLQWPEVLPSDPLAERQVAVIDDSLGIVSKETLADKLGYDWDTEEAQIAKEKAAEPVPLMPGTMPPNGTAPNGSAPPPQPLQGALPEVAKTYKSPQT